MKYKETFKSTTHELKTSLTEDRYEILSANLRKSPILFPVFGRCYSSNLRKDVFWLHIKFQFQGQLAK